MKFKNVLLIDDDEDCLFLTRHSIEKLQVCESVVVLTNGFEALDFLTDNCIKQQSGKCPDIIFVDNHMPGMNGFSFLERLNNMTRIGKQNFLVYMVSAFTNDIDKEKLEKYNVRGFINKPLSMDKLKEVFT